MNMVSEFNSLVDAFLQVGVSYEFALALVILILTALMFVPYKFIQGFYRLITSIRPFSRRKTKQEERPSPWSPEAIRTKPETKAALDEASKNWVKKCIEECTLDSVVAMNYRFKNLEQSIQKQIEESIPNSFSITSTVSESPIYCIGRREPLYLKSRPTMTMEFHRQNADGEIIEELPGETDPTELEDQIEELDLNGIEELDDDGIEELPSGTLV